MLYFPEKSSLKIISVLANSVYPDEMPRGAAFHLGFHCFLEPIASM